MGRNVWILIAAKAVRTFCYGYLGVLFPIYLSRAGLDASAVGIAVALTLFASAAFTIAVRRPSERIGPPAVLAALSCLIVISGALFLVSANPWIMVLAAMLGNVAVGTGESGPFLTLEQVSLARICPRERMTRLYSFYNLTGYGAAALGAALVACQDIPVKALFAIFLAAGMIQIGLYLTLKRQVQAPVPMKTVPHSPSKPLVRKLALLFSLDAFAGGFIVQSLVLYWLHTRFAMELSTLGLVAAGTQAVTGLSYLMAPYLAGRFGLVNAMVFTHLFSNLILIAIAFAPTAAVAVALLLFRHTLSQIDVPTRQAYLMSAVEDQERESAASLTNTSRTLAQCVSPALTGWMMGALSMSAPFVFGGTLKIAYDLMLYTAVRRWDSGRFSSQQRDRPV